jgi:hypothetical protein
VGSGSGWRGGPQVKAAIQCRAVDVGRALELLKGYGEQAAAGTAEGRAGIVFWMSGMAN